MDETERQSTSAEAQAVAAWVEHINGCRLSALLSDLQQQDVHLSDALASIDHALETISQDVVSTNRGGVKGMHGFIAEIAEVGIGNARSQVRGRHAVYQWIDDNGAVDLVREGVGIQQKFVASGGRLGLGAIAEHLRRYPDFLAQGGKYQVPLDHYETIRALYEMPAEEAGRTLSRVAEGPSFADWKRIRDFFSDGVIDIESIEPSTMRYDQVQRQVYDTTLESEREGLRATDLLEREGARQRNRPSVRQAGQAAATAAATEGGISFVRALTAKRREGKRFHDFAEQDWIDVTSGTAAGALTGSVRGISLYALTNVTAAPAAVASSVATAAFGIAEQAHQLRAGKIDELRFLENAELISVDASLSALSSIVGQALIPVPVLGAVIGNTVGTVMHRAASSTLAAREAALVERSARHRRRLAAEHTAQHHQLLKALDSAMTRYLEILDRAFSPDPEVALEGSVELAMELGVAPDEVLDTEAKIAAYFLE
ncbi:hypothetical protein [Nesterenkonia sp. PF2B19]|uniref:hypothetical protein n=1 Tax=Nesterenkonia sp. PF2B19 TaxID=1881858 RepID=UPI000872A24D|nr:hypothetical protein [Nesterenkonia sp. PF2B19]OSM43609.1 hypothetical protein BCY76_007170 [Nesterenkonia sp. PF2B19]